MPSPEHSSTHEPHSRGGEARSSLLKQIEKITHRLEWQLVVFRTIGALCFGTLALEFVIEQQRTAAALKQLQEVKAVVQAGAQLTPEQQAVVAKYKITL